MEIATRTKLDIVKYACDSAILMKNSLMSE